MYMYNLLGVPNLLHKEEDCLDVRTSRHKYKNASYTNWKGVGPLLSSTVVASFNTE